MPEIGAWVQSWGLGTIFMRFVCNYGYGIMPFLDDLPIMKTAPLQQGLRWRVGPCSCVVPQAGFSTEACLIKFHVKKVAKFNGQWS